MDNENKAPEEEKDKKSETSEEKAETGAENAQAETATETPPEEPEAPAEETTPTEPEEAAEADPEQPESAPEEETAAVPDPAEEIEALRAENTRLKAQLEAHGAGFKAEYIEDAVLIAENAANRDGITIAEALQAVAKKYPEWKHSLGEDSRSGFKVGAAAPKETGSAEDDQLDEAFGIRRRASAGDLRR
ncbi:MAG: hypothetical protein IJ071_04420 [Ruminococcus sp.]|nr:hypothetical protein [Ruminococcus sp.]